MLFNTPRRNTKKKIKESSSCFDSDEVFLEDFSENFSKRQKRSTNFQLREIMHEQKVNSIVNNFKEKIKRNNTESTPVDFEPYEINNENTCLSQTGIILPRELNILFSFIGIIIIILLSVSFTLSLVFKNLQEDEVIHDFEWFSLIFYLLEIVLNFFLIKEKDGKKISILRDIIAEYLSGKFWLDFACFLFLLLERTTLLLNRTVLLSPFLLLYVFKLRRRGLLTGCS